jgi:hypothetical protein
MNASPISFAPAQGDSVERCGKPIWERLFHMRVAYVDTLSEDTLKNSGMLDSGDRQLNRQMHRELVNVYITINAMVEYFKRGVGINFGIASEARDVYDIVNNYLLAWRVRLENGMNIGNAPTEDLMLLDRFAEQLYPVALKFGAPATRNTGSLFGNLFTGNGRFVSRDSFFQKKDEQGEVQSAEASKHSNHSGALAKALSNLRSTWEP